MESRASVQSLTERHLLGSSQENRVLAMHILALADTSAGVTGKEKLFQEHPHNLPTVQQKEL